MEHICGDFDFFGVLCKSRVCPCFPFSGVMSALKNLQDRLKQVECEKKEAEQNANKLAEKAAVSTHSAGKSIL